MSKLKIDRQNAKSEKYVELTATIAVESSLESRLDMLVGFHPDEKRWLSEEEEIKHILPLLRYMKIDDIINGQERLAECRVALQWLRYFPELTALRGLSLEAIYDALWRSIINEAQILHLIYAFFPADGVTYHAERKQVHQATEEIKREINILLDNDSRIADKIAWTVPFSATCSLGRLVEEKAGLYSQLKTQTGLGDYAPGFLCNYLLSHQISLDKALDPYQFEELVSMLFSKEGWSTQVTPRTRDGGKDIVATRVLNGQPIMAYVQAKRHAENRPVGLPQIKEFVATLAGDNVRQGYLVTSSYFAKPGVQWLQSKGSSLASVELLDRKKIIARMAEIANEEIASYLAK